ncbi:hypothetical protein HK104_006343, partial [Borealophlyctis nickersoniae]
MPTPTHQPHSLLSSLTLPPDVSTWSPLHSTAWAQALDLPQELQNHILDNRLRGVEIIALSEREVENICGRKGSGVGSNTAGGGAQIDDDDDDAIGSQSRCVRAWCAIVGLKYGGI